MYTLIADDNPTIAQSVRNILEKLDPGGTHVAVTSGREALEIALREPVEAAFLDVEMPDMNGLTIAEQLKQQRPRIDVVFITGYTEYAVKAYALYAVGYLLKPITEAQVVEALAHLRHAAHPHAAPSGRLGVRCFGQFEALYDGKPVAFKRSRTKMLLAYLIDRNGAMCSTPQMICALWPESPGSQSQNSQLRMFISDLQTTLTQLGIGEVLVRQRGLVGIDTALVDCDYYQYMKGDPAARLQFKGEYMSQYPFGEVTLASLTRELYEQEDGERK